MLRRRRATMLLAAMTLATYSCAATKDDRVTTSIAVPTTSHIRIRNDRAAKLALRRLIGFSARSLTDTEPFTLAILDYVGRRYEITEFANANSVAQQKTANAKPDDEPELRIIRATARPTKASLRDTKANLNSLLVRNALGCDSPGEAPDFEETVRRAVDKGGYFLTHAAVALGIEQELGCAATGGAKLRALVINQISDEMMRSSVVDDIAVERLAMLVYLDAGGLIPNAPIDALIRTVNRSGAPSGPDIAAQRHTAALAIWVLSEATSHNEKDAAIVQR